MINWRKAKGLSVDDLVTEGASRNAIYRFEHGDRCKQPSVNIIMAYCIKGFSLDTFVRGWVVYTDGNV